MRTLSVVITTPPSSYLTITAIDYITHAINADIDVVGVFFYQDGVLNASANISIPNDEYQTHKQWQTLNENYGINLHVCITACEKRGLTDDLADKQSDQSNISQYFTVSGLGELVELTARADKVVQF